MARRHGRNGRVYMAMTSGGTATPLNFQAKWSISFQTARQEVTALGDGNKIYVAGLPDASGDFSGYYDDGTVQTYTAATDGVPRAFYLYPDIVNDPGQYWFGTILPDFKVDGDVGSSVNVAATWSAASPITKVG